MEGLARTIRRKENAWAVKLSAGLPATPAEVAGASAQGHPNGQKLSVNHHRPKLPPRPLRSPSSGCGCVAGDLMLTWMSEVGGTEHLRTFVPLLMNVIGFNAAYFQEKIIKDIIA